MTTEPLYDDGTLQTFGSGGAASNRYSYYKFKENGYELKRYNYFIMDCTDYEAEHGEMPEKPYYNKDGEYTFEEVESFNQDKKLVKHFKFKKLYGDDEDDLELYSGNINSCGDVRFALPYSYYEVGFGTNDYMRDPQSWTNYDDESYDLEDSIVTIYYYEPTEDSMSMKEFAESFGGKINKKKEKIGECMRINFETESGDEEAVIFEYKSNVYVFHFLGDTFNNDWIIGSIRPQK